jgi:hypothetical protein
MSVTGHPIPGNNHSKRNMAGLTYSKEVTDSGAVHGLLPKLAFNQEEGW